MASDWYYRSGEVRRFVENLAPGFREALDWAIYDILRDPSPDEVRRVSPPSPPFESGLIATGSGPFWISYRIANAGVLEIVSVAWLEG